MANIFLKKLEDYKRNIDPVNHYIAQAAFYVHKIKGVGIAEAAEIVKDKLRKSKLKNPVVTFNERDDDTEDVSRKTTSLLQYIKRNTADDRIMVPSFTSYYHPSIKKSFLSSYTSNNVDLRNADKEKMYAWRAEGNSTLENMYNNLQKTRKIKNNAVSGGLGSSATSLFMPSGHYTLTSMTRTATSIANAVAETMIAGNRLYLSERITMNHIVYLAHKTNKARIRGLIDKYNLHVPTADEIVTIIIRSSENMWQNRPFVGKIKEFLLKLDSEELVNIAYSNDLYHMRLFNDALFRDIVNNINESRRNVVEEPVAFLQTCDWFIINAVRHRFVSELRKYKKIDYKKMDPVLVDKMASVAAVMSRRFEELEDLFSEFFRQDTIPPSISRMRDSLRKVTVLSDTDSTCATYQEWVEWLYGDIVFSDETIGATAVVMTITSQVIEHHLKQYAANLGIPPENRKNISYKGEFFWATMTPMSVSKHYYADPLVQEGAVFQDTELERKGVNLISSNIPVELQTVLIDMMKDINTTVRDNKKLDIDKYIDIVTGIEKDIVDSLAECKTTFLMGVSIKEANVYKNGKTTPHKTNYFHYMFWEDVFADRYGAATPPPYLGRKLPTTLSSTKRMKDFIATLDSDMQERFNSILKKTEKDNIGNMVLPAAVVDNTGIPSELSSVIDVNRVVNDICKPFYMVLESIGIFKKPDDILLGTTVSN